MNATSTLIACSNFGDCWAADTGDPKWDERTYACPNCGKVFASPHCVSILPSAAVVQESSSFSVTVEVKTGKGCAKPEELSLEINGERWDTRSAAGGQTVFQISNGLSGGLYPLRAVLKTSDGRTTFSDQRLLFINREPQLFAPLIWALLLILLVSLSASVGWFGKPLFGWTPDPWLSYLIDGVSLVSALLIGGLLLSLGLRERALAAQEPSLVRPRPLKGGRRSDKVLNRMGDTAASGAALIIVGALPFCFALAYVVGILSGNQQPWDIMTVLIAIGAVTVAVVWGGRLANMSRQVASKLPRRAGSPASEDAGPTPMVTQDPKLGALLATPDQPAEEDKSS
ncbi:hypothetical protein [Mesorhizobium sp. M1348]|uniref:hypothetical protein n=1 Tax=unclassified Mesorhizobium TaxID=325217 RepID=UPI00333A06FC